MVRKLFHLGWISLFDSVGIIGSVTFIWFTLNILRRMLSWIKQNGLAALSMPQRWLIIIYGQTIIPFWTVYGDLSAVMVMLCLIAGLTHVLFPVRARVPRSESQSRARPAPAVAANGVKRPIKLMHFLITGGLGFIGSHLVEQLLSDDHEITIVDDLSSGRRENVPANDRIKLIVKDVLDLDVTDLSSPIHGVAHLAAVPSVNSSWIQVRQSHDSNLTSTLRMIELCTALKIPRLVLASSAAVYGEPESVPIDENHSTRPSSPYGLQKLASEEYGKLFSGPGGFHFISLRLFNVYGPRQVPDSPYSGVISRFFEAARGGRPAIIYGDGSQTRDFVYVKDVAAAFAAALTRDSKSKDTLVCNIGTGKAISIHTLAGHMGKFSPSGSLTVSNAPLPSGDITHSCANIAAARRYLGFEPRYSLEEGLRLMFDESR